MANVHIYQWAGVLITDRAQTDFDLREDEIARVWQSMPLELAIYLSVLDKGTTEDEFFLAMRKGSYLKLPEAGLHRVGELASLTEDELRQRSDLTDREVAKVKSVLGRMGLNLGMDVTRWRAYREMVSPDFRLDVPAGTRLPSVVGSALLT